VFLCVDFVDHQHVFRVKSFSAWHFAVLLLHFVKLRLSHSFQFHPKSNVWFDCSTIFVVSNASKQKMNHTPNMLHAYSIQIYLNFSVAKLAPVAAGRGACAPGGTVQGAAFGGEFGNSASGELAFALQNGFGGFVR